MISVIISGRILTMSNYRVKSLTPSIITSIRIILAPIFFLTVINDLLIYSLVIFLFAMVTDVLDGYFSRKWDVSSSKGAYFDITADFILVLSGFSAFVIKDIYPSWILIIILFMFIQFIITSRSKNPIYDPVGKYYGAFLFITIFTGLITNNFTINMFLTILILIFTVISITSRLLFIFKHKG
jgi:CDP-diacylglycerol--glycerol-3-phosphate 3-phosphatidyltransferase